MTKIDAPMTGKMLYADKSTYIGELLNFQRNGQGTLTLSSGECISGVWNDNVNVQDATRTDSSGVYWEGSLRNLKPQGIMHIRLPNGQEYDGVWDSGDMLRVLSVHNREREPMPYVNAGPKMHRTPERKCTIWLDLAGVKLRQLVGFRFVHGPARRSAPTKQRSCAGLWSNRGAVFALQALRDCRLCLRR